MLEIQYRVPNLEPAISFLTICGANRFIYSERLELIITLWRVVIVEGVVVVGGWL